MNEADLPSIITIIFTRRVTLQIVAQLFDPLGLLAAYLIKFKLALREIVLLDLAWDTALPDDLQIKWREYLAELITAPVLEFPRAIRNDTTEDRAELIGYFDGSDVAFCGVVYARYFVPQSGEWVTTLVTSKARVEQVCAFHFFCVLERTSQGFGITCRQ